MIELIMVIVILGILAAFALPRFANLGADARIATLNGALGAARSAAAIAHSTALARPGQPVVLEGTPIAMVNAYPQADTGGIVAAAQLSPDFNTTGGGTDAGNVLVIQVAGAPTPATCSFTYTAPEPDAAPAFGVVATAGC